MEGPVLLAAPQSVALPVKLSRARIGRARLRRAAKALRIEGNPRLIDSALWSFMLPWDLDLEVWDFQKVQAQTSIYDRDLLVLSDFVKLVRIPHLLPAVNTRDIRLWVIGRSMRSASGRR